MTACDFVHVILSSHPIEGLGHLAIAISGTKNVCKVAQLFYSLESNLMCKLVQTNKLQPTMSCRALQATERPAHLNQVNYVGLFFRCVVFGSSRRCKDDGSTSVSTFW